MNAQNREKVSGEATGKKTFKSTGGKRSRFRLPVAAAQTEKPGGQVQPKTRPLKGGTLKHFPIVGVGASAGGLEAFTQYTVMAVAPNRVYVILPNTNMIIARGTLQLQSGEKTTGAHRSIDFFFASRLKINCRKQVSPEDVSCESVSK